MKNITFYIFSVIFIMNNEVVAQLEGCEVCSSALREDLVYLDANKSEALHYANSVTRSNFNERKKGIRGTLGVSLKAIGIDFGGSYDSFNKSLQSVKTSEQFNYSLDESITFLEKRTSEISYLTFSECIKSCKGNPGIFLFVKDVLEDRVVVELIFNGDPELPNFDIDDFYTNGSTVREFETSYKPNSRSTATIKYPDSKENCDLEIVLRGSYGNTKKEKHMIIRSPKSDCNLVEEPKGCLEVYEPVNYLQTCCQNKIDYTGYTPLIGDVDGDGFDDLVYVGWHAIFTYKGVSEEKLYCQRIGGRIMVGGVFSPGLYQGYSPVLRDFNEDGILDVGYAGPQVNFFHAGNKYLRFSNNRGNF